MSLALALALALALNRWPEPLPRFEMLTMDASIDSPPNARVLYARSSTSFWRSHVLLGMASLVGSIVRALPRMRSGQYVLQPWRRVLDRASIFLYTVSMILSFSVRQLAWSMDSQVTVDHLPWYDPVASPYFQTIFEGWRSSGPLIYSARALCCWLGLLIAIYPTGDHRHRPDLNRAAAAAAAAAPPHVLSPSEAELPHAGLAFSIACWRFGTPTIRMQPLPRSPDGGLPMLPVPDRRITALSSFANEAAFRSGMDRRLYSSRLMRIVVLLALDLVVETTADTIHWLLHLQLNLVRRKPMWDIVVFDAITFALTLFCRATVNITFFSMCVSTAYYKLGRIDRLRESYGRLMVLQLVFFVAGIGMRAHRIINDFRGLTTGDTELFLWEVWGEGDYEMHKREWDYEGADIKDDGLIYSLHKGLTLLLLLPYCAWTFDCARRLGRSEYHLHPDLESELSRR